MLDTFRHELSCKGLALPIAPQALTLLAHLIEHRDQVVTKEQLVAAVWNGKAVSDAALTTRINVLRSALDDSGRRQRLIRTFPRRGFRFIGEVREERSHPPASRRPPGELPSVAVLPFVNLSGDPSQDFFGDALAEQALTELARLRWLLVVARNSSFLYRGVAVDIRTIGSDLDVGYVLEGSARHANDRVRINCRLVDARTALQVWSSRYDRRFTDVFQILDEITDAVVTEIAPAILEAERNRIAHLPSDMLTAWEAYQRGVTHMLRQSSDDNISARQFFQQAVDLKQGFSPGFDGLAWTHLMDAAAFGRISMEDACSLGDPLARKALELDPNNASARARLALTLHLRGNNQDAIEEAETALSASPNCADACGVQGTALVFSGRYSEGRAALTRFLRLSPRDPARPIRLSQLAASHYFERDYENAARVAQQAVRDYPDLPAAYRWLAASLGQLGRIGEGACVVDFLRERHAPSLAAYVARRPPYFRASDHEHLMEGFAKAARIRRTAPRSN